MLTLLFLLFDDAIGLYGLFFAFAVIAFACCAARYGRSLATAWFVFHVATLLLGAVGAAIFFHPNSFMAFLFRAWFLIEMPLLIGSYLIALFGWCKKERRPLHPHWLHITLTCINWIFFTPITGGLLSLVMLSASDISC